jgi:hypothetical protein
MIKNKLYLLIALPLVILLGACSGIQIPGLAAKPAQAAQNNPAGGNYDPATMPLEQKLAIGTLKLEGTGQAVTAKQAADLLPLWQAVKSLSASTNTAPSEITAVYKQIEGVMTPDQTQAIQKITWTQADMQALMTKYGVTFGGGQGGQNLTADQRATRTAQFQSRNQNGGGGAGGPGGFGGAPGGAPGGPGGFGGAPGGAPGGAGGFGGGGGSGTDVARTPNPGQAGRQAGGGMNTIFIDPLIKLLQTRAAGQ